MEAEFKVQEEYRLPKKEGQNYRETIYEIDVKVAFDGAEYYDECKLKIEALILAARDLCDAFRKIRDKKPSGKK